MAKANPVFQVSVEKAVHEALQKTLQEIWDTHQVCVREISVDWVDVSTPGELKMLLTGLDMRTAAKV